MDIENKVKLLETEEQLLDKLLVHLYDLDKLVGLEPSTIKDVEHHAEERRKQIQISIKKLQHECNIQK